MVDFVQREGLDADALASLFRYFGEVETPKLDSPVYTAYALGIAGDPELLALAARVRAGQPPPNVLFAAVHDLLLEDPERSDATRALARFYPSITGSAIPDEDPFPAFRRVCREHRAALRPRIEAGRTQSCVVQRCAVLLPAFAALPRVRAAEGRLGLLEIGPAVGLNLRLDHYRYVYEGAGAALAWGAPEAKPALVCALRGDGRPPLPARLEVVARRGIELAPIDVDDPAALRWLRALIWPEHVERARAMDEALAVATRVPAEIEAGDATRDVEAALARLPGDAPRVVFATQALYQIPAEGVEAMRAGLARASAETPVDLVTVESDGTGQSRVEWTAFADGAAGTPTVLGHADSHGRWLAWARAD